MKRKLSLNTICVPSEDVVAREIQGEFIIIPITSGVGDLEDAIFTLNKTGKAIWNKLNGKKNLRVVAEELSSEFEGSPDKIEKDVLNISKELLKRKIFVEIR